MGYLPELIELTASIAPVSPCADVPLEAIPLAGAVHSMRDFPRT